MKKKPILDPRLLCAAGFVRQGARVCDVGCDHAYLPIFLCKSGRAEKALACDINEGPCRRAEENIKLNGCAGLITVLRTDGLCGAEDFDPTDVVICGMGGELIAKIIFASPITRKKGVRLILQPMTKAPALRDALTARGFSIVDEALVRDGRIYQVIAAEFTGRRSSLSDVELLLGPVILEKRPELFREFVEKHIAEQKKILLAKKLNGIPCEREEKLISTLEALKEEV